MTGIVKRKSRAFWLSHLHLWHWISSALCLIGMILFAVTGITLNHAADIEARPRIAEREVQFDAALLERLQAMEAPGNVPLPEDVRDWLASALSVRIPAGDAEWSRQDVYLSLPRPGGDAWLSIDLGTGAVLYENTDRGWISYLNDLHKGRNTGAAWSWFIDVFAASCIVFCVTGLLLLQFHARVRPGTWPVVGLGLVIPLLVVLLSIH